LTSLCFGQGRELGELIQKESNMLWLKQGPGKAEIEHDEALLMSFYPHGSGGAVHLNLKWQGVHDVNEFTFESAGEVQECQTETEHTGWVILQPYRSFYVKFLLPGGGVSYTGLCYGAKFPLTLTEKKREPVRQQGWCYFWRFVRPSWKKILQRQRVFAGSGQQAEIISVQKASKSNHG
jgi:hypothetical protein